MTSWIAYPLVDIGGSCLSNDFSNVDLHILTVSPKHASPILFIFDKEIPNGEIVWIFLVIILSKNKSHVSNS